MSLNIKDAIFIVNIINNKKVYHSYIKECKKRFNLLKIHFTKLSNIN